MNHILMELMDLDAEAIAPHRYLVRDLGLESIDFLELAVLINDRFQIPVEDDTIFLRNLRLHLATAGEAGVQAFDGLKSQYPFLPDGRLREILADLDDGPVIQVRDLLSYVQWQTRLSNAA